MYFNPNKHHRRSIRLKGYDYNNEGLYFITLCCENRIHLFGKIINGRMILNLLGQIAHNEWLNSLEIRDNIKLHDFIVMPNHFHAILEITFKKPPNSNQLPGKFISPSHSLGSIIRGYKIATTKKIKELLKEFLSTGELQFAPTNFDKNSISTSTNIGEEIFSGDLEEILAMKRIWQRNYYEHIIRTEKSYRNISNYIRNNSNRWKEDKFNR